MWTKMQIHSNYKNLKWFRILERINYERNNLVDNKAEKRLKILLFFDKYWLEATLEAFEISERTIYNWKKKFRDWEKTIYSLSDKSRKPHKRRKREWSHKVLEKI